MGGIELARHLCALEHAPAVIFVTAHDRHAVQAFELNALDYLMKPVRAERLAAALKKALVAGPAPRERLERAAGGPREFFSVTERNRIVLVPVGEVLFLKAELKYVTLRTLAGEHLIEEPLVSIEREFADRFVRVHRNCLVARAAIRGFERVAGGAEEEPHWSVMLEGATERLPVSRRLWPTVKAVLPESRE
jgi:two-component system response regulator AlgR